MQRWRAPSALALSSVLLAVGAARAGDAFSNAEAATAFDAQIARLDARDPRAPEALQAHLRYAAYLVEAPLGDCAARLAAAQAQWQAAESNVALDVVLPQGSARAADIAYQIHAALADCGAATDTARRARELRAALEFAQRAAALYADTFDYPAMLTMQFNVAVTYRDLGDDAAFDAALKSLLEDDRKYGFAEDAEENYRLLGHGSPDYLALTSHFPRRSIALKFAWVPGNNAIKLKSESVRAVGDALAHTGGEWTLTRHVRKRFFGWTVTYDSLDAHFSHDPVAAGSSVESSFMAAFAAMLTRFHDFNLTGTRSESGAATADFEATVDDGPFKARVLKDAQRAQGGTAPELGSRLKELLASSAADFYTALDYNLETGAWPGATLEQGQWYGMELHMPLPYAPLSFVRHQVQFAFTRELPCSADSNRTCAELVLRAVPEETDLTAVMRQLSMHLQRGQKAHAWSTLSMRLVTDPLTLQAYSREVRQFFYLWIEGAAKDSPLGPLLGADRTVIDAGTVTPAE